MVSDWLVYSHVLTGKLNIHQCYILDDGVHTLIYGHSSLRVCALANVWIQSECEPPPLTFPPLLPRKSEGGGRGERLFVHMFRESK